MSSKNPISQVPSYLTHQETMSEYILYFYVYGKYMVSVDASGK